MALPVTTCPAAAGLSAVCSCFVFSLLSSISCRACEPAPDSGELSALKRKKPPIRLKQDQGAK